MFGVIAYTLYIIWIAGSISIFIDVDHVWTLFRRKPPIKLSKSYGRPFHTRVVFTMVSIIASIIVITLGNGFYRGILLRLGVGGTNVFFFILIIVTFGLSKYIGSRLHHRMMRIRCTWRKQAREKE